MNLQIVVFVYVFFVGLIAIVELSVDQSQPADKDDFVQALRLADWQNERNETIILPPPSKPHFRVLILVLASQNQRVFINARRVWLQYKDRYPDQVKVVFVYGRSPGPLENSSPEWDLIYEDIEESYYRGMILKTQRAIRELMEKYTYDFFIRTNLSTFWDLGRLLENIRSLPDRLCYQGHGPHGGNTYLSGADTLVNGWMANEFGHFPNPDFNVPDDQAMGFYFHGHLQAPFIPAKICFLEKMDRQDEVEKVVDGCRVDGADHYRVKFHVWQRREDVDWMVYRCLMKKIYGMELK